MRSTSVSRTVAALALGVATSCTTAAPAAAQLIDTPHGPVELVGLERWSAEALLDSVTARAPDARPTQHPMILREMGFARAHATPVADSTGATAVLLTVVEPHRAELVRLARGFDSEGELPARWEDLARALTEETISFQSAVNLRWFRDTDGELPAAIRQRIDIPGRPEAVEQVWSILDGLGSPEDLESGLSMLARGDVVESRMVAAAVLSGFPEDERAWRALVEALLDPSPPVTSIASQALGSMVAVRPMEVDWAPSTSALRSLLAGANLPSFPLVLQVLISTGVSPEVAPAVLREGGILLLGHLGSDMSPHRELAHGVLVRLRGEDPGPEVGPWEAWIQTL